MQIDKNTIRNIHFTIVLPNNKVHSLSLHTVSQKKHLDQYSDENLYVPPFFPLPSKSGFSATSLVKARHLLFNRNYHRLRSGALSPHRAAIIVSSSSHRSYGNKCEGVCRVGYWFLHPAQGARTTAERRCDRRQRCAVRRNTPVPQHHRICDHIARVPLLGSRLRPSDDFPTAPTRLFASAIQVRHHCRAHTREWDRHHRLLGVVRHR